MFEFYSIWHNRKTGARKADAAVWALAITLMMALSFLQWGCGARDSSNGEQSSAMRMGNGGGPQTSAIPVQATPVVRTDISTSLLYTTTVEAESEVEVLAKVSGQVAQMPAEEGLEVRRGAVLAHLDEAELRIQLEQARIRMETDQAAFDRAKNMLDKNLISAENFDATRFQFESSKAAYEEAKLKVDYTTIRSPIDGVVTARLIELGQRVNVNQALFRIADFVPMRAKIYVPEKDMRKIFEGQTATLSVDAVPGMAFTGVVRMISPIVDPTNGTVKVTLDIENPKHRLKPGMFASVQIMTETHKNTLAIPKKALLLESQTDQVFVIEDGLARKRLLQLGFTSGDLVEVVSGLNEGDLVITVGQEGLREGLPVRIPGEQVTQAPARPESESAADGAGPRRGQFGRPPADGSGARPSPEKMAPAGAADAQAPPENVDPAVVARVEEAFMKNRFMKMNYERKVAEDPALANDPARKMAFFKQTVRQMEDRIMQNPMAQEAYAKEVEKNPDLEKDLVKKLEFYQTLFRNMRRGN